MLLFLLQIVIEPILSVYMILAKDFLMYLMEHLHHTYLSTITMSSFAAHPHQGLLRRWLTRRKLPLQVLHGFRYVMVYPWFVLGYKTAQNPVQNAVEDCQSLLQSCYTIVFVEKDEQTWHSTFGYLSHIQGTSQIENCWARWYICALYDLKQFQSHIVNTLSWFIQLFRL